MNKETKALNIEEISYQNLDLLQRYTSERGKILPVRLTGLTRRKQRDLSIAVKRARFLALMAATTN